MFNHENLKGRVAVVTGGGGVLCGGFAKDLARQGVKVATLATKNHQNLWSQIADHRRA